MAALLPTTIVRIVPKITVMVVMMVVVAVAWIDVVGVIARVDIGITIAGLLVRIVSLETIIWDFAVMVLIPPPVRCFDEGAGVCRNLRVAGDAGDRRGRGGHCRED